MSQYELLLRVPLHGFVIIALYPDHHSILSRKLTKFFFFDTAVIGGEVNGLNLGVFVHHIVRSFWKELFYLTNVQGGRGGCKKKKKKREIQKGGSNDIK